MAEEKKVKAIDDAEVAEETAEKKAQSATETKNVSEKKAQSAKGGKSSKKGKKDSKKNQSKGLNGVIKGLKTEFSKITWPSRNEITKETITVLVVSVILGLCIFGLDKLIVYILFNVMNLS